MSLFTISELHRHVTTNQMCTRITWKEVNSLCHHAPECAAFLRQLSYMKKNYRHYGAIEKKVLCCYYCYKEINR